MTFLESGFSRVGFAGLTAFFLTLLVTPIVRRIAVLSGCVDRPAHDRWGRRAIARLGGVGMFLTFLVSALLWLPIDRSMISFLIGLALVFLLGFIDDLRRIPPYTKLIGQLLIGCVMVFNGINITLIPMVWLAIPLSILWFVLVMNAFNLLDNMDGLAAGVAGIASGFCLWHAVNSQQWTVAILAAIVSGSCLGFLRYNFPPAKIFMGDSGSHLLGLSLAALALMGSWHHSTQLLSILTVPTLVLALPIFDTCFVTIQRLMHRQHPFSGGTDHVSHRLAVLGLSARQTVTVLYVVSAGLGLLSVVSTQMKPLAVMALWLSVITALLLIGRYLAQVEVYRLEPPVGSPLTGSDAIPQKATLIETMLMHKRRLLEVLVDFLLICSVYVFAHLLRFEGSWDKDLQKLVIQSLPLILFVKLSCFAACGLYRGLWRYVGLSDIVTVFKATSLGSISSALALLYLWRFEGYSRAVFIIDGMLTFLAVGGSRVIERLLNEWISGASAQINTLIIGAGDTGAAVLRSIKCGGMNKRRVVGFLDDSPMKHGESILGVFVLGNRKMLPELVDAYHLQEILVAIADPPADLLEEVRACCQPRGLSWRTVSQSVLLSHE
ncbi:MAG: hypothetical protein HYY57_06650 [Candidatus Omnitrophica bacterium]|nr:hypothetical protein [Candidatus Omnitrophota bacterium]